MKSTESETQSDLKIKFLLLISSAHLATSVNIQGFLSMMPFIQEDFVLTRAQAGMYSAFLFLSATFVAIFSGRIVDIIGTKKGIVFGPVSVGVMIIIHSIAPSYLIILILAFFTGLGFSIITPSINKAVIEKVSPRRRAASMGISQSGGGIGGVLGASLLPVLGELLGWRLAIMLSGIFALFIGFLISQIYRENPSAPREDIQETNTKKFAIKKSTKILLKNKQLLTVCLLGLALGGAAGAIPAHYTLYLTQDLMVSRTAAGVCLGILQIGGIVGRPTWGHLSDKVLPGKRNAGLIFVGITFFLITLGFFMIGNLNINIFIIYLLSFILGTTGLGWHGLYFTAVAELASENFTGLATGLSLIFIRAGVVVSPPLFGYLADLTDTYRYSWLAIALLTISFTIFFKLIIDKLTKGKKFNIM